MIAKPQLALALTPKGGTEKNVTAHLLEKMKFKRFVKTKLELRSFEIPRKLKNLGKCFTKSINFYEAWQVEFSKLDYNKKAEILRIQNKELPKILQ